MIYAIDVNDNKLTEEKDFIVNGNGTITFNNPVRLKSIYYEKIHKPNRSERRRKNKC